MKRALIASLALTASVGANAAGMLQWQNNSLSYLYGTNYKLDPSQTEQTMTFEHVSGWSVGDLFMFVDGTHYNGAGENNFYAEISPRFSLGKITGQKFEFGPVKDLLVATTFEFGDVATDTLLLGVGADLALPGFDFFNLNVYQRMPKGSVDGDTIQITPVWQMTFPVAESAIVFDGFIDWVVTSDGSYESNLHINPQVKYDISYLAGLKKRSLLVGAELDYWKNRYGVKDGAYGLDTDQATASLIVKYHF